MQKFSLSITEMLQQLIATPSMSSVSPEFDISNKAVIDLLSHWLEDLGFKLEIMPLPSQPHKANLLASIGPVYPECQGLMFAGHTDTVPYDAARWSHDPFQLHEQNNRFYGLGTTDMKAFFALVIDAVRNIDISKLEQPIFILATADEESSMEGARMLVDRGCPSVKHAVIGEPTGLKPINAHKGMMMESIQIIGQSGHSSNPSLGINAMEAMHEVIGKIMKWRESLQKRYNNRHFEIPIPTLNLGHIHGGDNPNRICGSCDLHIDLRPLPGMNIEELRQELSEYINQALKNRKVKWSLNSLSPGTPPLLTPHDSPIVCESEKLTNHKCSSVAFCTEGPYLQQLGIDTIILGPGDIDQAHQPDEYIAFDRMKPMISIIEGLIEQFCYKR